MTKPLALHEIRDDGAAGCTQVLLEKPPHRVITDACLEFTPDQLLRAWLRGQLENQGRSPQSESIDIQRLLRAKYGDD